MERAVTTRKLTFTSSPESLSVEKPPGTIIILDLDNKHYIRKAILAADRNFYTFVTESDYNPYNPEQKLEYPMTMPDGSESLIRLRNKPMTFKRWLILIIIFGISFAVCWSTFRWYSIIIAAASAWICYEYLTAPEVVFIRNDSKGRTYHV